jgi:MtrB/PioB family decaheme-associated outer membrane protein
MRRLTFVLICLCAIPVAAQQATPPAGQPAPPPGQAAPPPDKGAAPATQVAAPSGTADPEAAISLFELAPNQVEIGGRLTTISGDPARFQRYQDFRDGLLFDGARFSRDEETGAWLFRAAADNVGWRDQRYAAEYENVGRFRISAFWDQIPQFYSVDTRTPYTRPDSPLELDNTTQLAIQNKQATLSAYVPLAVQFDLRERRDTGSFGATITPTPELDLTGAFTTTRHVGELPWGASFGFSNDVEVALPYDSRTNDVTAGAEWTNGRGMVRLAYDGSWFNNLDDTLVWDSPLQLDDTATLPGRGRMALWPSNTAHTFTAAGSMRFASRSRVTGAVSYGLRSNDEPLQPFTINSALPQLELPATGGAEAQVFSTNLSLVSRPASEWVFGARLRHFDYANNTGHIDIPQFINYDTSVKVSSTGGPEPFAHSRTNLELDATWTALQPLSLTIGYAHNASSHDFRIFENAGEHVLRFSADTVGSRWLTFRTQYEFGDRHGSALNEDLLVDIGEQPALRHYDIANRTRHRFSGQADIVPNDIWIFSATAGIGTDDFDDSYFGLQDSDFRVFGVSADALLPNGWGGGISFNRESYGSLLRSRSANPGQENDPARDWTADSDEEVDYVSITVTPPRFGRTEARASYDFSYAEGRFFYAIVAGGPLTPPNQLPHVFNKLQQLHLDIRHRLTGRVVATFSYLYEPFRVFDFAFDPGVVDGIVQPSSLVLGHVYRPYTAHSAVFGLKYLW